MIFAHNSGMNSTPLFRPHHLGLAIAVSIVAAGLAQAEPITTTDVLQLKTISSVDIAPDSSFAVFGLRSIVKKDKGDGYTYSNHLWRISLTQKNAQPVALTSGKRGGRSPEISPDGTMLAFVRTGEGDKPKSQVWIMSLDGPGEARQLTTLEHGASSPHWFPDGKSLLVSSSIPFDKLEGIPPWDNERPHREWKDQAADENDTQAKMSNGKPDGSRKAIRRWLAHNASKQNPAVIYSPNFLAEHDLQPPDRSTNYYVVNVTTGDDHAITQSFYGYGGAQISPDGKWIACVSAPHLKTHPDREFRSSIFIMDTDGSDERAVLGDPQWAYGSPRFSPDGNSLYFTRTQMQNRWGQQNQLMRTHLSPDGSISDHERLAENWQSGIQSLTVNDRSIVFRSPWHGGNALVRTSDSASAGRSLKQLIKSPEGTYAFDATDNIAVAAVTSVANPVRLIAINSKSGKQRILYDPNAQWLHNKDISLPTKQQITRDDGTTVEYWVMEPTNRARGEKYPTVLEIHGGPSAMWGPGELSMWHEFQLLCAWGYGIVYSNPRGSGGYGYEFQSANYQDWGFGPMGDVLACLDEATASNDWMDTDRLFVTGGSYAGYLTAFIVGNDHRFKAAVAQRGVYDLETFFGEGNAWPLVPWAFGGYPWEPGVMRILDRESPFTYVSNITTPLLIMHSSQDLRTGVSQSEMMYRALKQLNREVEYVRYPNAGHDLSRAGDPTQRMDRLLRIVEFFERYAKND